MEKHHIDEYFKTARQDEPLLSMQDIKQLIENAPIKNKSKFNFKKIAIMTSISITLLSGALYFSVMHSKKSENISDNQHPVTIVASQPTAKGNNEIQLASPLPVENESLTISPIMREEKIVNTQNVKLLTLTNKELAKLGIKVDSTGIYMYKKNNAKIFEMNKDKPMRELFGEEDLITYKWASYIRYNNTKFDKNENNITSTVPVMPAFVTDTKGEQWISYFINTPYYKVNNDENQHDTIKVVWNNIWSEADEQLLDKRMTDKVNEIVQEKLSTLVPVLIYSGESFTKRDAELGRTRYGIILWYEASEKFFNALPAHIAKGMRNDYEAIIGINTKATSNCEYFEVCRGNAGTIKKLVSYPNPSTDQLHISFSLDKSRNITLKVTDIMGKLVSVIADNVVANVGENKFDADVSTMKDGMYLLYVQTNAGEYITQRIMVKH